MNADATSAAVSGPATPASGGGSLPRVSVIVRSTARPTLERALESIGAQDYPDVEAVVVAASGPGHPAVPAHVGRHRVVFAPSLMHLSRPDAANAGLDAATGDWITFLDDDDTLSPDHVSGLVAATRNAPEALAVYTLARARFADGRTETWGRPYALIQLYERNFIHLSTALFSRTLVARGCRFDPQFEIMQDWDFFLQIAQHTHFHFEPRQTFEWHADAGSSGAGGGANQDDARFVRFRDMIYAKWASAHEALIDSVTAKLQAAQARAQQHDLSGAETLVREVLAMSPNDPFALNMLAMLQRSQGRIADARATLETAVAIRPDDPSFLFNLALLCRATGDIEAARGCCWRALEMDSGFAPASDLLAALAKTGT
jgi:tetratricopeptide (TPR) repeat protein